MIRLLLVRHGQTIWNAEHRYQGQTDIPLSPLGEAQALAVSRRLAGEQIDAMYSSDLQRARHTASHIAALPPLDVREDRRLREMAFGEWEGLTYAEITARDPQRLAEWASHSPGASPPAGETREALEMRVQALLSDIAARHADQTVLLVAHGGTLLTLLALALGLPAETRWRFRLDHATLSELHLYENTAVLALLNDACHLAGLDGHGPA